MHDHETHVIVPRQGSDTFSVEAAVATVPRGNYGDHGGHALVLDNGAHCERAARLTRMRVRRVTGVGFPGDAPGPPAVLDEGLHADASITHVS